MAFDMSQLGGAGMDIDIRSMPLLHILQQLSAEVNPAHEKYATKGISGAKAGEIAFSPDNTTYASIQILPIKQVTLYSEWRPNNGGLVGHHNLLVTQHKDYTPRDPKDKKSKEHLGENELTLTMYWAVLFLHKDGEWTQGILSFTNTQLSFARALGKMIMSFQYPNKPEFKGLKPFGFSQSYLLSTEIQRNASGAWYGWSVKPGKILSPTTDEKLLEAGLGFYSVVDTCLPAAGNIPLKLAERVDDEAF